MTRTENILDKISKRGIVLGDGGYAPIAEALFNNCDVDAFLLEYDSDRAGDFAPLRNLPAGKRAYLGIISTKNPASTMGVSSSSACESRAVSGATAASNTVV